MPGLLDWRPGRTITLCSWDAEEYGLIGSTEWVEVSFSTAEMLYESGLITDYDQNSRSIIKLTPPIIIYISKGWSKSQLCQVLQVDLTSHLDLLLILTLKNVQVMD